MNKAYKSIYSEATGTYVAVSENVKAKGKRSSSSKLLSVAAAVAATFAMSGAASAQTVEDLDDRLTIVESGLDDLKTTVGNNKTDADNKISALTTTVGNNKTDADNKITALTGRVDIAEDDISTLQSALVETNEALDNLQTGADGNYTGIKYFRVNSNKADAVATGADAVAIGPEALASGANTVALGNEANASGQNSTAIGNKTAASGSQTIAIGNQVAASGSGAIALGGIAREAGKDDLATAAKGVNGIALGLGAQANAKDNISLGFKAGEGTGLVPEGDEVENIAIGANSGQNVKGQTNTALGIDAGQNVTGNKNVAIGTNAGVGVFGDKNISIGINSNNNLAINAERSIAIGENSNSATDALAIGSNSTADTNALALGFNSTATGTGSVALGADAYAMSGSVALGNNSRVHDRDLEDSNGVQIDGTVVSVGNSDPSSTESRRIVNVADGVNANDAVTVKQLDAAVLGIGVTDMTALQAHVLEEIQADVDSLQHHFISITPEDGVSLGNYNNDGAKATNAIAIGPDASVAAGADHGVALGSKAASEASRAIAFGQNVKAKGIDSVVIGQDSESWGVSAVAIGTGTKSRYENSIVIGTGAEDDEQGTSGLDAKNSIVIGTGAKSVNEDGMALGREARARAERGIAQGVRAFAGVKNVDGVDTTVDAIAVGTDSYASANNAIAQGTSAQASGVNSTAIGNKSEARGANSIAFGNESDAFGLRSIAQGDNSVATAQDSQAFGTQAQALKVDSQAFGTGAIADGLSSQAFGKGANTAQQNAQAFGTSASATGVNSQAFGAGATASALNSQAFGTGAIANRQDSIAIGNSAKSTHEGSVALGAGSETDIVHQGKYFINDDTSGFTVAGKTSADTRTVSVGTKGNERQIQNVAPGVVSASSTDAINGSQLHATNVFANNLGTDTAKLLGGDTKLNPNGTLTNPNFKFDLDGGKTYQNVQAAMSGLQDLGLNFVGDDNTNVHRRLGGQLSITGGATGNLTTGNIGVTEDDDGLLIQLAEKIDLGNNGSLTTGATVINNSGLTITNGPKFTSNGIDAGGQQINGVKAGVADTDAVNVSQLKDTVATSGWNLAAGSDAAGTTAEKIVANDTVIFNAGQNMVVERNGAAITYSTADAVVFENITVGDTIINEDNGITTNKIVINHPTATGTENIDVGETLMKGITFVDEDGNDTERKLGDELTIAGDDNITTTVSDGKVQVSLNKDVDLTRDGSLKIGDTFLDENGLVITGGPSVTKTGINAGNKTITSVASAIGTNSIASITDTATLNSAVNVGDLKSVVTGGLKFNANDGGLQTAALGSTVTVKGLGTVWSNFDGGQNIMTNIIQDTDGNTNIDVALAKDLKDLYSIELGSDKGNPVTLGGNTDGSLVLNGGISDFAVKITNVAPGVISSTSRDAINGSQLFAMGDSLSKFFGDGMNFNADGSFNWDSYFTGIFGDDSGINNLADALEPWTVSANGSTDKTPVLPGDNVDFSGVPGSGGGSGSGGVGGSGNIVVGLVQDADGNHNYSLDLADNIHVNQSATVGDKTGPYVVIGESDDPADDLSKAGGVTFFSDAVDSIDNRIAAVQTVAAGPGGVGTDQDVNNSTRLVYEDNKGDDYTLATLNDGLSFTGNTGTQIDAPLNSVVSIVGAETNTDWGGFDAGQNIMTQTTADGQQIVIALSKNIKGLETIIVGENGNPGKDGEPGIPGIGLDGKDGVIGITGKDGIDGADGIAGMDGSSADITVKHGAPGIDGNDGVDGETKTRIVYEKPDGEVEEVATLNDGLYFQGDVVGADGNVARKLNQTLALSGGESDVANLAVGNPNVGIIKNTAGDGYDFLLAKDLTGLNSIQIGNNSGFTPITLGGNADGSLVLNPGGTAAKITNVAAGDINSTSTDAINGSQLQAMGDSLTQFFGEGINFKNGTFNWENYFTGIFGDNSTINNLADALEPWTTGANGGDKAPVLPGDNVDISPVPGGSGGTGGGSGGVSGGGNIVVNLDHDGSDHNYTLDLADDIHVGNSVTVGDKDGAYISMGDDGGVGSPGSLNFYGEPDANGDRITASQTVVAGPGGVGTDQEATDGTRLGYTDGDGNEHVLATLGDGLSFGANDGDQHDASLNTRVDIVGSDANTDWTKFDAGQNIMTQVSTNEDGTGKVTVALANDITVNSVTAETVTATTVNATTVNATAVNTDSITINNGGPIINQDGINMNDNRITNVAPGIDGTDAVNVDQLAAVNNNLQQQIDGNRHDIKRNNDRANAGIAAAMATAGLPQAYLPGKSMVAVAGGVWRGESGMAIGVSTVSENGKWVLKGSANTSGRGGAGGTIGAGYQW